MYLAAIPKTVPNAGNLKLQKTRVSSEERSEAPIDREDGVGA